MSTLGGGVVGVGVPRETWEKGNTVDPAPKVELCTHKGENHLYIRDT